MVVRGRPSKIPLWDSWLRRDALKAFGRAFGKPSSLFTATCSKCCVDRLSRHTQLRHWVQGSAVRRVCSDAPKRYARGGGGAGVRPWRRMISTIFARSGGPPAAALITSANSRKYCGPIAAGVITQSALASWVPWLSNR